MLNFSFNFHSAISFSKSNEGVHDLVVLVFDLFHGLNLDLDTIHEQNFFLMVETACVQEVVPVFCIPLDMEQDLLVFAMLVLPGEPQSLVFVH